MRIKSLTFRNIMPFGNDEVVIPFDSDPLMWLIMGDNGAGKSTMLRMLKLVLYQEYGGIPVDEIANEVNKNGYIGCSMESRSKSWYIEMGFKPNFLRVYSGDSPIAENLIDKGKIPETKKFIKESIVDMPYYIFDNIVSLSINDFKSFLNMSPKDTRNIRDRIFNFYAVNEMNEIHKKRCSIANSKLDSALVSLDTLKASREEMLEKYNSLKDQLSQRNESRISEIKNLIADTDYAISSVKDDFDATNKAISLYEQEINANIKAEMVEVLSAYEESFKKVDGEVSNAKTVKDNMSSKVDGLLIKTKEIDYLKITESIKQCEKDLLASSKRLEDISANYRNAAAEYTTLKELITKDEELVSKRDQLVTNYGKASELVRITAEHSAQSQIMESNTEQVNALQKSYNESGIKIFDLGVEIQDLTKKIELYESNKECPTCGSDLSAQVDGGKLRELTDDKESKNSLLNEIALGRESVESSLYESKDKVDKSKQQLVLLNHEIANLKSILGEGHPNEILESINKELESITLNDNISEIKEKAESFKNTANSLTVDGKVARGEVARLTEVKNDLLKQIESLPKPQSLSDTDTHARVFEDLANAQRDLNDAMTIFSNQSAELASITEKISSANRELEKYKKYPLPSMPKCDAESNRDGAEAKLLQLKSDLNDHNEAKTKLELEYKSLTDDEFLKTQLKSFSEMLESQEIKIEETETSVDGYRRAIQYNSLISNSLSDSGIKAHIMKEIVPYLNFVIEETLTKFGLPIQVQFDDVFTPTIFRRGKKVSLKSISTGQTNITDLAILFSIIKLIVIRFKGINFVQFDEILGSISEKNRVIVLDCLKNTYCGDMGMHVFIVNHFFLPGGYIDKIVSVKDVNSFSVVEFMNPDEVIRLDNK